MNLELSLKQTLKLTPQMLQSMEVLQMSTQELADYIQDLVQMTPPPSSPSPPPRATRARRCGGACSPWPMPITKTANISLPTGRSWTPWPG